MLNDSLIFFGCYYKLNSINNEINYHKTKKFYINNVV